MYGANSGPCNIKLLRKENDMNIRDIENTLKLLITNSESHPAIILSQVNGMVDYLEKLQHGCYEGLRTDEISLLEDLIKNVCFLLGFQRPEGQWY